MELKNVFRTMMVAVCCLGAAVLTSCDNEDNNKIKFSVPQVNMIPGATAKVAISNGTQPYSVRSVDEKVATVKLEKNVMTITGVKEGKTSIVVTDKKKMSATLAVNVMKPLDFDKQQVEVAVGKEETVVVKSGKAPYTAMVKDNKIATATVKDSKIMIKGIKAGTTTVSVLDKNKLAGTVVVTVK